MTQHHCCAICKRNDVRLYRWYGEFLRDERIYCGEHKPDSGWIVPLVEALDGSVWGYTSVPEDALAQWNALPDAPTRGREGNQNESR